MKLGGSEYYEYIHNFIGGTVPQVDIPTSKKNMTSVLSLISKKISKKTYMIVQKVVLRWHYLSYVYLGR